MAILKLIIWPLISLPLAIDPAIELAWIPLLQCTVGNHTYLPFGSSNPSKILSLFL